MIIKTIANRHKNPTHYYITRTHARARGRANHLNSPRCLKNTQDCLSEQPWQVEKQPTAVTKTADGCHENRRRLFRKPPTAVLETAVGGSRQKPWMFQQTTKAIGYQHLVSFHKIHRKYRFFMPEIQNKGHEHWNNVQDKTKYRLRQKKYRGRR